jgi:hypothetical protein
MSKKLNASKLVLLPLFILFAAFSSNPYTPESNFAIQLKAILNAGDANGFTTLKGDYQALDNKGRKTYACTLPLEGFETTIVDLDGTLQFNATARSGSEKYNLAAMRIAMLNMSGLQGYTKHDNAKENFVANQVNTTIIMYSKPGATHKLLIFDIKETGFILVTKL